jgi:hypothetical protein
MSRSQIHIHDVDGNKAQHVQKLWEIEQTRGALLVARILPSVGGPLVRRTGLWRR